MKIKYLIFIAFSILVTSSFIINDWYVFESAKFEIYFPNKPESDTTTSQTPNGNTISYVHMYQSPENSSDSNLIYVITVIDFPPQFLQARNTPNFEVKFFDGLIDAALKTVNGRLISEKPWSYKNYPGREIIISYQEDQAIIKTRILVVEDKSYAIQTMAYKGKEINQNAERFFNTFKLK